MDYNQYITRDPKICGGEPIIRRTRITVRTILSCLAEGATIKEILADFPSLKEDDVHAAIVFAATKNSGDFPDKAA